MAPTAAFAAALPDASDDLCALTAADSVAVDPHKWLYAPLEVGCALVREAGLLRAAFAYHPPYYHFDEHATNYSITARRTRAASARSRCGSRCVTWAPRGIGR